LNHLVIISVGVITLIATLRSLMLRGKTTWNLYIRGVHGVLGWWLATLSMFASMAGGFMIFGLVQMGYEGGLTGYIIGLAYIIGMPLLIIGLRKATALSITERGVAGIDNLMKVRYGNTTHLLFNILNILLFGGVLAAQFVAIAFYLKTFLGIENYIIVIIIGCLGAVFYTSLFGFRGVISNDIIQAIFIIAVSIIIPFSLRGFNLASLSIQEALRGKISGDYSILYPIFGFIFLVPSFVVRTDLWQRLRITTPKGQIISILACTILLLWFYFIMTSIGRIIRINPSLINQNTIAEPGNIVPLIIQTVITNPFLQIICLSGILLALLSSIDAYLNIVSLIMVKLIMPDIWENEGSKVSKEETENARILKLNAKVMTFIVALIAAGIAIIIPDIVDLLSASFSGIGVLLPIVLGALYVKRRLPDWLGASTIAASLFILIVGFPFLMKIAFIPSVLIGFTVYAIGILISTLTSKNRNY